MVSFICGNKSGCGNTDEGTWAQGALQPPLIHTPRGTGAAPARQRAGALSDRGQSRRAQPSLPAGPGPARPVTAVPFSNHHRRPPSPAESRSPPGRPPPPPRYLDERRGAERSWRRRAGRGAGIRTRAQRDGGRKEEPARRAARAPRRARQGAPLGAGRGIPGSVGLGKACGVVGTHCHSQSFLRQLQE